MAGRRVYALGESDVSVLAGVVEGYAHPPPRRPPARPSLRPSNTPHAHLVYTHAEIPALARGGTTGTPTGQAEDDLPGSLLCRVYRLVRGRPRLIPNYKVKVYNFADAAVPAGAWVLVHQDRYGTWVVGGGAGAAGGTGPTLQLTQQTCVGNTIQTTTYTITFPAGTTIAVS
jgi:hypothetical protein